jgi:hypothetical protein
MVTVTQSAFERMKNAPVAVNVDVTGIMSKLPPEIPDKDKQMLALYVIGLSPEAIAAQVCCKPVTVRRVVWKYHVRDVALKAYNERNLYLALMVQQMMAEIVSTIPRSSLRSADPDEKIKWVKMLSTALQTLTPVIKIDDSTDDNEAKVSKLIEDIKAVVDKRSQKRLMAEEMKSKPEDAVEMAVNLGDGTL